MRCLKCGCDKVYVKIIQVNGVFKKECICACGEVWIEEFNHLERQEFNS